MTDKIAYRDQLRKLPEVFTLPEVRRVLNYTHPVANITVSRWAAKNLVSPLAHRSGVYFNLERNPRAREEHMQLAISKKYPVSRILGPQVLVNYGWTTQIQHYLRLGVNLPPILGGTSKGNGYLNIPEARLYYRSKKWWIASLADEPYRDKKNVYIQGFESVSPAFALVDMWLHPNEGWFPDADDLFLDNAPEAASDILRACQLLNVDPSPLFSHIMLDFPSDALSMGA